MHVLTHAPRYQRRQPADSSMHVAVAQQASVPRAAAAGLNSRPGPGKQTAQNYEFEIGDSGTADPADRWVDDRYAPFSDLLGSRPSFATVYIGARERVCT